jgi:tetratricopeptide (TPR) repeat protein
MTMLASADGDEELLLQLNVLRLETAEGIARVPLLVERLRLAASLGRASEASGLLCEVELAGCSPALLLDVADALVAAGRVDCVQRALAALDAAGGAPRAERGRAAFCRGWTLEQRGETEAARAAYREGQTTQPPSIPAMRALARLLGDEGEWAAALDVLLAALLHQATLDPGDRAELYYAIGIARLQTGDEPRAGEMFRRALALAPDHAGARAALDIDGGG